MIDEITLNKILSKRKQTKNILAPDTDGYSDDKNSWLVANDTLRGYAQGLIDNISDHRHLKGANILLLEKRSESTKKKILAGEKVVIGKAAKANHKDKLLSAIGVKQSKQADFIVWVSGDWLDLCDAEEAEEKAVALIDHELMHCGAKIAGQFIDPDDLDEYVESLGKQHIETCSDIEDEEGNILVRFYHLDKSGHMTWQMRGHDIEEFNSVIERHGTWKRDLCRLIDVIVKTEKDLFSKAG